MPPWEKNSTTYKHNTKKKMVVSVQEILSVFVRVGFLSCRYGTGNYEALIIFLKVRSSLTSHETKTRKFSYITQDFKINGQLSMSHHGKTIFKFEAGLPSMFNSHFVTNIFNKFCNISSRETEIAIFDKIQSYFNKGFKC